MAEEELVYLAELIAQLEKARNTLEYSYEKCTAIGAKEAYDAEEQERFESLTSKFARLSDIIIRQAQAHRCPRSR